MDVSRSLEKEGGDCVLCVRVCERTLTGAV